MWPELVLGVERLPPGARRDGLRAFVDEIAARLPVLPYDRPAASWHARERARLTAAGHGPAFADETDDYALVVHVKEDDPETRAAVTKEAGDADAVRIVRSGAFTKF